MVILFSLCPNQVSLILATHLTLRYKGNKSESWDIDVRACDNRRKTY